MNRICRKSANENTIMHVIGALSTGILFKELKMEKQRKLSHDNYSLDPNVFLTFFYDSGFSGFKGPVQVFTVSLLYLYSATLLFLDS